MAAPNKSDLELFKKLVNENRYCFEKLVFLIFPFGEKGTDLEFEMPYEWQMNEWKKLSLHLNNPLTRHEAYKLIVSSGNGAAKTAFGAMTYFMLMYTQRLRARITANTRPQMTSVVWPEYDIWFRRARFSDVFFEKLGESIKARDEKFGETWRLDAVTWSENSPASISGLHNKGAALMYIFEEAPGIPAIIWKYASGAMTDVDTIKIWLAFGNSDDPESKFEQCMQAVDWHSLRIDTRTVSHVDPKQIKVWLDECYGDEDHDDFRVRVRGLPRKAAKDSIINFNAVQEAFARGEEFDNLQNAMLPAILTCDPAWTGGDETTIWMHQGNYSLLLDVYALDKEAGDTHMLTYKKLCQYEKDFGVDAVFIDQGEGTALKTLAANDQKHHWHLVSFAGSPTDALEFKDSEYANLRAQMYHEANKHLREGGVIQCKNPEWIDKVKKQLCWTKGTRHVKNLKKLAESKKEIHSRVGSSPDLADGYVLQFAVRVTDRLPENETTVYGGAVAAVGSRAIMMPDHHIDYDKEHNDVYR